jgi:hypothetical protein
MNWTSHRIFPSFTKKTVNRIGFHKVQYAIQHKDEYIIINTLPREDQSCLITGTLPIDAEEKTINDMLHTFDIPDKKIIIYGKNSLDETALTKYKQLVQLGLTDIFIYNGGMFEWLLLQDICDSLTFPTTKKTMDLFKYA